MILNTCFQFKLVSLPFNIIVWINIFSHCCINHNPIIKDIFKKLYLLYLPQLQRLYSGKKKRRKKRCILWISYRLLLRVIYTRKRNYYIFVPRRLILSMFPENTVIVCFVILRNKPKYIEWIWKQICWIFSA